MISKIEALSDRLLTMLVPRAQAQAVACWRESCGPQICVERTCCQNSQGVLLGCSYCARVC